MTDEVVIWERKRRRVEKREEGDIPEGRPKGLSFTKCPLDE